MIFTKPRKRHLPKISKTLPIKGDGEDAGKYFHCWNCNFVCNKDRDALGGANTEAGDDHIEYINFADATENRGIALDGLKHFHVIMELDGAGEYRVPLHNIKPKTSGGCPLCGSKNWRGDF